MNTFVATCSVCKNSFGHNDLILQRFNSSGKRTIIKKPRPNGHYDAWVCKTCDIKISDYNEIYIINSEKEKGSIEIHYCKEGISIGRQIIKRVIIKFKTEGDIIKTKRSRICIKVRGQI